MPQQDMRGMRGETVGGGWGQAHHLPSGMRVQPDATTQQVPVYMCHVLHVLLYARAYAVVCVWWYVLLHVCAHAAVFVG